MLINVNMSIGVVGVFVVFDVDVSVVVLIISFCRIFSFLFVRPTCRFVVFEFFGCGEGGLEGEDGG